MKVVLKIINQKDVESKMIQRSNEDSFLMYISREGYRSCTLSTESRRIGTRKEFKELFKLISTLEMHRRLSKLHFKHSIEKNRHRKEFKELFKLISTLQMHRRLSKLHFKHSIEKNRHRKEFKELFKLTSIMYHQFQR